MRIGDGLIGGGFALAGAAVFAATLRFPRLDDGAPGPALFPQVLAVLMVVFGGGLLVSTLRARGRAPTDVTAGAPIIGTRGFVNTLWVFGVIIAFMLLAPKLGFLLTTSVLLFLLMARLGTAPVRAALASIALTLFVYVVFGKVLRVPLPLGLVWF